MKPSELLRTTGWTQGVYARDAKGEATNVFGKHGVCFCAYGAMIKCGVNWHIKDSPAYNFTRAIMKSPSNKGYQSGAIWNDDPARAKEEVIAKFEEFGL